MLESLRILKDDYKQQVNSSLGTKMDEDGAKALIVALPLYTSLRVLCFEGMRYLFLLKKKIAQNKY